MRTWPALVLACLLCAVPALGLEPYLVKDINPVPEPGGSSPDSFVTLGSVALFGADDVLAGRELWRSDGTAGGTWQVADLCQPDCSGNPRGFAITDRLYYFLASDAGTFVNLWVTDGTPAGTFQLTDASIGVEPVRAWIGDILYFAALDNAHGSELWRSDGTPAGTYRVVDLRPGPEGSSPRSLTVFKGSLYFSADDGRAGGALWRTDGTAAGTVMVKDPVPAFPTNDWPALLQAVGNRLVFVAPTRNQAAALWSSDGTAKGTEPFRGVFTAGFTMFRDFSAQGSRLYFIAEDTSKGQELWVTDGTANGTRRLTTLPRKKAFFGDDYFLSLPRTSLGNRFVFAAFDGPHGVEPWITDGTVKGTRLLRDLCPGSCRGLSAVLERGLPGRLFLTGTNGVRGRELWVTDGTEAGTRLVRDICRGSCDASPFGPFVVKDRLVFVANDGGRGDEVWSTDGTAAGTVRLSDFDPAHPWGPFEGTVAGGQLLFAGAGPEGRELWRTDGTAAGTWLVRDIEQADLGGSNPSGLMALGDEVFFSVSDGLPGLSLWKSDGTEAGTLEVRRFSPDETDVAPWGPSAEAGGLLFFLLRNGELWRTDGTEAGTFSLDARVCCTFPELRAVGGTVFFASLVEGGGALELWASDGTVAGTRPVRHGGSGPFDPRWLALFQGKLYFSADDPDHGRELRRSDGTESGTVPVKDIHPGSSSDPWYLTVHGNRLWFFADDGEHGRELWSSDGTANGTVLAAELEPGPGSFEAVGIVSLGDRLLITGRSPSQGSGIWVIDGTAAGPRLISHRGVNEHAVFQGRLYFGSRDADFRELLWVTDGTEEGTVPVFDRNFVAIMEPVRFAVLGDRLLFMTREIGVPLWESDGTPAGTFQLLTDTRPGSGDSGGLVRAGSHVFFPAFSREDGNELWAVEEAHP